jgi:GNAT superfamily N-acetyltransferase
MTEIARFGSPAGVAGAAEIRPIGLDDLSDVRYIHATSFRMIAAQHYSPDDIAAFTEHVYGLTYTDALSDALRRQQLYGAWFGGELVGTAGWFADDNGARTARLRYIFVRPLFTGLGLGRRLLLDIEDRARQAAFHTFTVHATLNAVGFFTRLGYQTTSFGVWPLSPTHALPVAIMRKMDAEPSARAEETEAAG